MPNSRTTINVDPTTHAQLQILAAELDSPSLGAAIYFLVNQNKQIPPAERTQRSPQYFSTEQAETKAKLPIHSIQIGDDTYHTLKRTKELHYLRSWDAVIQRYLYTTTEGTLTESDKDKLLAEMMKKLDSTTFLLNEQEAMSTHLRSQLDKTRSKLKALTQHNPNTNP